MELKRSEKLNVSVILGLTCWAAYFWQSREFGLYEDDYSFVGIPISIDDWSQVCQYCLYLAKSWATARPVGRSLAPFLGFVSYKAGGLWGIYLLCYAIVTANSILFYNLMRYRFCHVLSLLAALLFVLFPADTTKCLITHGLVLQVSIMFLLLSSLFYMRGYILVSYSTIFLCLLTYESAFLPFFILPFYRQFETAKKRWIYRVAHIAVLFGQIALVWAIRLLIGNPRVVGASGSPAAFRETIRRTILGYILGPKTALQSFYRQPLFVLRHMNLPIVILVGICGLFFYLLLKKQLASHIECISIAGCTNHEGQIAKLKRIIGNEVLTAWGIGLSALVIGYSFSFTRFPPVRTFGRGTSVHLAASFGASIFVAGCLLLLLRLGKHLKVHPLIKGGTAVYLSLLVCFGHTIQADFARSWKDQRQFWKSVLPLISDMGENTFIFVESKGLPKVRQVKSYEWAYPILLEYMYVLPEEWQRPPRLFVVSPKWRQEVTSRSGGFFWEVPAALWPKHLSSLPAGNLILIRKTQGKWMRITGNIELAGEQFALKPPPEAIAPVPYTKTPLYLLVNDGDS